MTRVSIKRNSLSTRVFKNKFRKMSLFRFKWLRRFIRTNTRPIPEDKATVWKKRFSFLYVVVCWNCFGLVCYQIYKGKNDWAAYHGLKSEEELLLSSGQKIARTLGLHKPDMFRVSGLQVTKIEEKEMSNIKE